MTVELYSKPGCQPCKMSKKHFATNGIEFAEFDVTVNDDARDTVLSLGFLSAPVVVVRDADGNVAESWGGFNPDKIKSLATA
jgi:glutaredoxin-like protein NrdH